MYICLYKYIILHFVYYSIHTENVHFNLYMYKLTTGIEYKNVHVQKILYILLYILLNSFDSYIINVPGIE